MLLLRRTITLSANDDGIAEVPITISLYRKNVDAGYQWMAWTHAETGYFDALFLETMLAVANSGMC